MNVLTFPIIISSLSNYIAHNKTIAYCDFNPTNPIKFERIISDFSNNKFRLFEMENSYAIYQVDNEEEFFIEGSFETNSPYYNHFDEKLYYLGPGYYITYKNGAFYDLLTNDIISENLNHASYRINKNAIDIEEIINANFPVSFENSTLNKSSTSSTFNKYAGSYIDANGFRVINNAYYFKELNNFPKNDNNLCGIISLSIILSYLDTFYHDDFIDDSVLYKGYPLINKTEATYSGSTYINFEDVNSMPYPSSYLRDLLFNEFNHEFPLFNEDGNPMADKELKDTFTEYLNCYSPHLLDNIYLDSWNIFNVIGRMQDKINCGWPVIATMLSYTTEDPNHSVKDKFHDPIVIGYKGSQLLCHAGWHDTTSPCIVFSTSTLYTFVSFEFSGAHKHSNNVTMEGTFVEKEVCGCGFTLAIC